ncbi:hypothetical protein [Rhodococcus sp. YH1]|uniref:hypothetical protein n=1 Tax=Rhodococcus sp. YH1 TaxID=89066 RepID=UPI001386DD7A|nr:hypothetical protein [Rhodococcus sp. YH1]
MNTITNKIAEGRRLLDEATPGPWRVQRDATYDHMNGEVETYSVAAEGGFLDDAADAELIVWSRNNLPALLDRLERIELERIELAEALEMAENVVGYGWHIAEHDELVERANDLTAIGREHDECPVWCDECERFEHQRTCAHCNGSGVDAAGCAKSGAYAECEWCAGDGREHGPDPASATAHAATNAIDRVRHLVHDHLIGDDVATNALGRAFLAALNAEQ